MAIAIPELIQIKMRLHSVVIMVAIGIGNQFTDTVNFNKHLLEGLEGVPSAYGTTPSLMETLKN